jgi:hypothetical protein
MGGASLQHANRSRVQPNIDTLVPDAQALAVFYFSFFLVLPPMLRKIATSRVAA